MGIMNCIIINISVTTPSHEKCFSKNNSASPLFAVTGSRSSYKEVTGRHFNNAFAFARIRHTESFHIR